MITKIVNSLKNLFSVKEKVVVIENIIDVGSTVSSVVEEPTIVIMKKFKSTVEVGKLKYRYYYYRKNVDGELLEGYAPILLSTNNKVRVTLDKNNNIISETESTGMDIHQFESSVEKPKWKGLRKLILDQK